MLLANLWISIQLNIMIIMSDGIRTFLDIIDESWKFSKILFTFRNLKTTFGWFGTSKSLALSGLYAVFLMYYNQITSCCSGERCGPWASCLNIHMNICIIATRRCYHKLWITCERYISVSPGKENPTLLQYLKKHLSS